VLQALTSYRFIDPGGESRLRRECFDKSAMAQTNTFFVASVGWLQIEIIENKAAVV